MPTGRLPGTEDAGIAELDELAVKYERALKRRMKALNEEVALKEEIMGVMKANKKRKYVFGEVSIEIVTTAEKIKVKVAKEDAPEGEEE